MSLKEIWKNKVSKWTYGIVGGTAFISLIWAFVKISQHNFYRTMGFFGFFGFWILIIGGLNWGIKAIFGKDLFGN